MNQMSSPNSRSPVTLGDFIKKRRNKKSPDNFNNPRSLFASRESHIDFSVNDINFEKIQNKKKAMKELKWSENDVDFTIDNKTCSFQKCLKNDENVRPLNNFRVPSYSSGLSDVNFNNEHYYLPESHQYDESTLSYFPFDRVELDDSYYACAGQEPESEYLYYFGGTTYYNVEEQLNNSQKNDVSTSSDVVSNIVDGIGSMDIGTSSGVSSNSSSSSSLSSQNFPSLTPLDVQQKTVEIEQDEELNSLVISIIDD